ncbi:MAG: hypothetical protein ABI626_06385 [Sphingomicrobium sp.]
MIAAVAALVAASSVSAQVYVPGQSAPAAPAAPAATVAAIGPGSDFTTATVALGSWTYRAVPGGSEARFIDSGGTARLIMTCTKATRRVSISHTSGTASTGLFVWTSSATRTLAARFEANAMRVTAELFAQDALLDEIAFSRGRIAVLMAGGLPLVVPAGPEAARTVEDCRI